MNYAAEMQLREFGKEIRVCEATAQARDFAGTCHALGVALHWLGIYFLNPAEERTPVPGGELQDLALLAADMWAILDELKTDRTPHPVALLPELNRLAKSFARWRQWPI